MTGDDGLRAASPMRCRSWNCRRCGPAMRNRVVHCVTEAKPERMLTLTSNPNLYDSPEHAARRMSWALPKLIAEMREFRPQDRTEYFAVWERTAAGWPHLHLLTRGPFVHQRFLSRWWRDLTGAYIVYVEELNRPRAGARYVAKYLTKDPRPFGNARAYRASNGFFPEPVRSQSTRASTLGAVRVFDGSVKTWALQELANHRFLDGELDGQMLSAPWSTEHYESVHAALFSERQRRAILADERPPPPPWELATGPVWVERPPPPT